MSDKQFQEFNFKAPISLSLRKEDISPEMSKYKYRTEFMRDRDRVMYCSSFRRLSGKTQIYLTGSNDNQRNRLTHTLEVSQIARTIAHALELDSNLTEAIALGHDLGHTPFGHAGERILHEIMTPNSKINIKNSPMNKEMNSSIKNDSLFGFKHNIQSVRVVAELEDYQGKYGLNLTNYTLWGILHHSSLVYKKRPTDDDDIIIDPNYRNMYLQHYGLKNRSDREAWSFEAYIVAQADEIAQWHHDLEDALRGGAMSGKEVCQTIRKNLGSKIIENDKDYQTLISLEEKENVDQKFIADISQIVVNTLVNWLVECSRHNLNILREEFFESHSSDTSKEVFFIENTYQDKRISEAIGFSKFHHQGATHTVNANEPAQINGKELAELFSDTISNRIHHSRDVERMNAKGKYIIKKLFQAYYSNPQQLDDSTIIQYMNLCSINTQNMGIGAIRSEFEKFRDPKNSRYDIRAQILLMRKICDRISGMTDRYAISEYESLYG